MSAASPLDRRRIGWIGLGKWGSPFGSALLEVTALTPNPEGRERAARANFQSQSKIAGVVASARRRR